MTGFDADAVGKALRCVGLDLSDALPPSDLGKGRWGVAVVSRMRRDPLGTRVVRLSGSKWTVEGREEKTSPGEAEAIFGGRAK